MPQVYIVRKPQQDDFTLFEKTEPPATRTAERKDTDSLAGIFNELLAEAKESSKNASKYSVEESLQCRGIMDGAATVNARATFVRCFRGQYVSVTFRAKAKELNGEANVPPMGDRVHSTRKGDILTEGDDWHKGVPGRLFSCVWPKSQDAGMPTGLVYITGGTKSYKSFHARALIDRTLSDPRFQRHWQYNERCPHVLTYEDPIEKYMNVFPTDTDWSDQLDDAGPIAFQELGIDYTPREKGKDVGDLHEALRNALRQTPAIVYVGEVRDDRELRVLIEFAGSGHLVITTGHASSLSESVGKLLRACSARTPSAVSEVARKLCAVVHLLPYPEQQRYQYFSVPAIFRANSFGRQALVSDGRACLVPATDKAAGYCWGREWFVTELLCKSDLGAEESTKLRKWALECDLSGL